MGAILWLLCIAGGFLSGSVMYCALIPKHVAHKDVSALSEDGNPGAFNVFQTCGVKLGMLCLTLDIFKGLGSVLAASLLADVYSPLFILVVIAPIFGHALGLFNRFHGGKCIATSFGVTAGLLPVSFVPFTLLALLYIFFAAILNIKPHKVCSIIVYSLFAVASLVILCVQGYVSAGMGCLGIGIIAVIKHLDLFQEERVKKEEEDYEEQF